jgi:hypothetical protein
MTTMKTLMAAVLAFSVSPAFACSEPAHVHQASDKPAQAAAVDPVFTGVPGKASLLKVDYSFASADKTAPAPGIVSVWAVIDAASSGEGERLLIDRIAPFAPANADGGFVTLVQVPETVSEKLASDPGKVTIELEYDGGQVAAALPEIKLQSATFSN